MIPILFEKNTESFNSNGIGCLADVVSCIVEEERNGAYELEMRYPIYGIHYEELVMSAIIWVTPSEGKNEQAFRIYKITKPINGIVSIYAEHISYQLASIPVSRFSASSASAAMAGLKEHASVRCPFSFWTDVTRGGTFSVEAPAGIRSKLGGTKGSILDIYGGEYEWDNYMVQLRAQRGRNDGVSLRYGKNITDLSQEENITNTITGIYPYWQKNDEYVELDQKTVLAENAGNFPYPRIVVIDCTNEFEEKPSQAALLSWAKNYVKKTGIGVPSISISVSFAALWQTEEYKGIAPLERVRLCDTIQIEYPELGVSAEGKVIRTRYNVLLDRYDTIEIGDARPSLAGKILSQQTQLDEQQKEINEKPSKSFMEEAVENATNWITGTNGGYVLLHKNGNDQPYEIVIMDTNNINTAQKVWRWNQGGLGYSRNGYNGPYTTAITQDGSIVADFITTGTMMANIIKGGTLTLGGLGNGNGICRVLDENGKVIVTLSCEDGVKATKGSFEGKVVSKEGEIGPWTLSAWSFYCKSPTTNDIVIEYTLQGDGTYAMITKGRLECSGRTWFKGDVIMDNIPEIAGGASGSFQTAAGSRVRVKNGIITEF